MGSLEAASWPLAWVLSGCMEAQGWNRLEGALHLTPAWNWRGGGGHWAEMFCTIRKNVCGYHLKPREWMRADAQDGALRNPSGGTGWVPDRRQARIGARTWASLRVVPEAGASRWKTLRACGVGPALGVGSPCFFARDSQAHQPPLSSAPMSGPSPGS